MMALRLLFICLFVAHLASPARGSTKLPGEECLSEGLKGRLAAFQYVLQNTKNLPETFSMSNWNKYSLELASTSLCNALLHARFLQKKAHKSWNELIQPWSWLFSAWNIIDFLRLKTNDPMESPELMHDLFVVSNILLLNVDPSLDRWFEGAIESIVKHIDSEKSSLARLLPKNRAIFYSMIHLTFRISIKSLPDFFTGSQSSGKERFDNVWESLEDPIKCWDDIIYPFIFAYQEVRDKAKVKKDFIKVSVLLGKRKEKYRKFIEYEATPKDKKSSPEIKKRLEQFEIKRIEKLEDELLEKASQRA